jgi:hypothetical protein
MTLRDAPLAPNHKVNAVNILDGAINRTTKTAPLQTSTIQKLYNNETPLTKIEITGIYYYCADPLKFGDCSHILFFYRDYG